ncbi:hypothetical protein MPNTM1_00188 [Mycolicibacterium parafortuitum]|uniref:hypothetical protein n=1 Tax=Mycolicibacterium parafortuitum TaxID=39692 RepID=UPI0032C498E7
MTPPVEAPPAESPPMPGTTGNPTLSRLLRWALITAITVLAFVDSLHASLANTRVNGINGYTWIIPASAVLAAGGLARRKPYAARIDDRQTDVIVAVMVLTFAVLVYGVLTPRYAAFFWMLRLDLVAMVLFVVGAGILLFGLRAVTRFDPVWAMVILALPFGYHVAVIVLGGGKAAGGVAALMITAAATAIAAGTDDLRVAVAAAVAWSIGPLALLVIVALRPDTSLLLYQQIPTLASIVCVSAVLLVQPRSVPAAAARTDPVTVTDVWWGSLLVAAVGIAVAVIPLPPQSRPPPLPQFDGIVVGRLPAPPAGWHVVETGSYDVVRRLYGSNATLDRQKLVADVGNPEWDKFGRPRTVVVDTVTTDWPMSLRVFPPQVLFAVNERLSERRSVDLGHGITGELLTAVDDDLLLTWSLLEFEWDKDGLAQRFMIASVDNHELDAPFPEPNGAAVKTLGRLFTILFRGSSVVYDETSSFKDADMLTEFGRGFVEAQMRVPAEGSR